MTTARKGCANVMAMSWHMMVEFEPPLVACLVSGNNHSFAALRATKECVIAIPTAALVSKVVGVGNCSAARWTSSRSFGLIPVPSRARCAAPGGRVFR